MLHKSLKALFLKEDFFEDAPISVIFAHLDKDKIDASSKKASFDTRLIGIQKLHQKTFEAHITKWTTSGEHPVGIRSP